MNYLSKLFDAVGELPKGQVNHLTVLHDDYCAIWKGGACNCDPEVVKGKPEDFEAGKD
ncbi:MAG: hypothetical protein ACOCY9_03295 [Desulfohalobiaceae bacterium]